MEAEIQATFEHCGSFNSKLKDTLTSLLNANNDRKSEIDALRGDHDQLRSDHDAFQNSMERENDLRKNEIRSLEERQQKDNQVKLHVWVNGMGCDPLSISHFEFCRVTFYVEEMRSGTGQDRGI